MEQLLLESRADEGLEVRVGTALVQPVAGQDLADGREEALLVVARRPGQVEAETGRKFPLRLRVVLLAALELVELEDHVPRVDSARRL